MLGSNPDKRWPCNAELRKCIAAATAHDGQTNKGMEE